MKKSVGAIDVGHNNCNEKFQNVFSVVSEGYSSIEISNADILVAANKDESVKRKLMTIGKFKNPTSHKNSKSLLVIFVLRPFSQL